MSHASTGMSHASTGMSHVSCVYSLAGHCGECGGQIHSQKDKFCQACGAKTLSLELPSDDDDDMPSLEPATKGHVKKRPKLTFVRYLADELSSDDDDAAPKTKTSRKKAGQKSRSRAKSK